MRKLCNADRRCRFGNSVAHVIDAMTEYRRTLVPHCALDEKLPVIFNEYMHLSWDNPDEQKTRLYARCAAAVGAEYYVIDCGWHNKEDGDKVYNRYTYSRTSDSGWRVKCGFRTACVRQPIISARSE